MDPAPATPTPADLRPTGRAAGPGLLIRRAAGLDEHLLARFEGDRRWYTAQILLVTGVATMAATSMTTTLTMTTGASPWGWPIAFGIALGLFVAVCDLSIVLPDGQAHRRTPATYAGRVGFSLLLGGLTAMPLTAAVFQRDVDRHEQEARQQAATSAGTAHQQAVIDTRAAVHAAHTPAIAAARTNRDDARRQADDTRAAEADQRRECNDEINGAAGSGIAGQGPRASAKCAAATDLAHRLDAAEQRATDTDAALTDALRAETTDADAKAAAVPVAAVAPYQHDELGVVDRIARTHDRLGTPATLAVTLALMALDTLPVILKLAHGPTTYERVLARHHQANAHQLLAELADPDPDALSEPVLDASAPTVDDEELEALLRARLTLNPDLSAKDLHAFARARGYTGRYSTFTRYLRTQHLRPCPGPDGEAR